MDVRDNLIGKWMTRGQFVAEVEQWNEKLGLWQGKITMGQAGTFCTFWDKKGYDYGNDSGLDLMNKFPQKANY